LPLPLWPARKVTVVAGGSQVGFPMASMQVCVGMMAEVEDDPDWARSDEEVEDPDETRNCDVGAQALDRLAIALGHKTALPVAFQLINEQLALEAQAWIHPHTALHAMCQVVEAGKDTDLAGPMQAQVVQCASHLLGHAHPRVRYMALQALGQLLLDHGPDVHRSHHAQIVPALVASIDASTNPSPRVRSHALAATINFVDYCEPSELAPYLDQLLVAALGAMQVGPRIVQEQAVAMVSSASMVMEEQLGLEQYNLLMPILQQALAQCPAEFKLLKGRLLECISLLGLAVPKEKFAQDVMPIMAAMAQASDLNGGLDADDPQKTFILKAWVRIGKALGQDFVPYLSVVMPALLHAIETSVESELRPEQLEEDGGADVDSDTECIIQNAAGKLVQVRTSALEDQATAAHMILLLAESLGPHFFPYVERCAGALAPLAVTSVHDDVRTYAMAAMPELVSCAAQALAPQPPEARWTALGEMLHFFVSKLIEALEKEGEMEALMTAMQSLKACVENACRVDWSSQPAAPGGLKASRPPLVPSTCQVLLSEASMTTTSTRLLQCLAESIQRRAVARAEAATDEDYDEEQREADALKGGEEEELQFNMSEVLGALLKTHGQAFLPQLSREWMPRLSEMSNEACLVTDRKLASYIFCDAIEYCGEAIAPLLDTLMPLLLSGVDSDEPTLRQPCAYGVGVAACKATQALGATGWVDHCLERLCAAASKSGARDGEQESATDNVVSAIGALCVELAAHPSVQRDRDPLWQLYLSYLPLKRDLEEAAKATLQLCRLTRAGDEGLLGVGRGRLPRVWELVLSAIGEKGTTDVVHREITETIGFLTTSLPAGEIEALWAATSPEVAQKARALVQSR